MQRSDGARPYAYRDDPTVPAFDDSGPVAFMDGDCVLCTRAARLIARMDHARAFKICPVQSDLGQAVLRHFGLDPQSPESWLYLADGRGFTSLDAVIRVAERLGGCGRLLRLLRILPRSVQDWLYRRVARNRYRLFGKTDMCAAPDPGLRDRLIG